MKNVERKEMKHIKITPLFLVAAFIGICANVVSANEPLHVMFAFVDHFEPFSTSIPETRIWVDDYIDMACQHVDADGRHPVHSYFAFWAGYEVGCGNGFNIHSILKTLNEATYQGYGEVEYHLHHGVRDEGTRSEAAATNEFLTWTNKAINVFNSHGAMITAEPVPQIAFGFIHGMWALDNSRTAVWNDPNSARQYCGVNQELRLLRELNCYADFTFKSPMPMTPEKTVDSIFYARDDEFWASYQNLNNVFLVEVNQPMQGDLMIIESSNAPNNVGVHRNDYNAPATLARMDEWVGHNVHVVGQNNWVFVKVYTHGCLEDLTYQPAWDAFFGPPMDQFYTDIETKYNDGINWKLHYVSAREMYNIVKAAEAGMTGDPGQYRDFVIKPYGNMKILSQNKYRLISYSPTAVLLRILGTGTPVDFSLKEFGRFAHIEESSDPNVEWFASDASATKGTLFGELHFVDSTPSPYYKITPRKLHCDLNDDGLVNFSDYAILGKYWTGIPCDPNNGWCEGADVRQSGVVDLANLMEFCEKWLEAN